MITIIDENFVVSVFEKVEMDFNMVKIITQMYVWSVKGCINRINGHIELLFIYNLVQNFVITMYSKKIAQTDLKNLLTVGLSFILNVFSILSIIIKNQHHQLDQHFKLLLSNDPLTVILTKIFVDYQQNVGIAVMLLIN